MNVPLWIHVLVFAQICASYKILVVSPYPGKSHSILGDGYVNLLIQAGHEVTYITGFPNNASNPLLREIDVSENEKYYQYGMIDVKAAINNDLNLNDVSQSIFATMHRETLTNKAVSELIFNENETFDLVIAAWMYNELYSGLPVVFDCPLIWFSTMEPHFMILRLIDEKTSPAYTSVFGSLNIAPFTFRQRVEELIYQTVTYIMTDWILYATDEDVYNNIYGPAVAKRGRQLPPYQKARFNASLVLGNSHVSLGQALSLPQSYKPVAGFHINPRVKPLPKNLQMIMDKATSGVIYFSMGSLLKSQDMPQELKHNLIKFFSQLRQTVLWKFEQEFPKLPKDVHVLKWAPQQSILSGLCIRALSHVILHLAIKIFTDHPNCVLFITHGGILSITEAVHFGVPIIGIPVFGDQYKNVQQAVHKGFAIKMRLSYNMAEDLERAVEEILTNPSYRRKVKELSFVYHHRPATPRAEIVHWVEHVIKTRGAPQLRSPALNVPWYQKWYLDLLALIAVSVYMIFIIARKIISLYLANAQKSQKKKNK